MLSFVLGSVGGVYCGWKEGAVSLYVFLHYTRKNRRQYLPSGFSGHILFIFIVSNFISNTEIRIKGYLKKTLL